MEKGGGVEMERTYVENPEPSRVGVGGEIERSCGAGERRSEVEMVCQDAG